MTRSGDHRGGNAELKAPGTPWLVKTIIIEPKKTTGPEQQLSSPDWLAKNEDRLAWRPLCESLAAQEPQELTIRRLDAPDTAEIDLELEAAFKQAYEEGMRSAEGQIQATMDRYHAAIAELGALRAEILKKSEVDLVTLALHIASEVIAADASGRLSFAVRMVEHALDMMSEADRITIRVGPTDYRAIEERFAALLAPNSNLRLIEDHSLDSGGIIAESSLGRIDATVERRLSDLAQKLRAAEEQEESVAEPAEENR